MIATNIKQVIPSLLLACVLAISTAPAFAELSEAEMQAMERAETKLLTLQQSTLQQRPDIQEQARALTKLIQQRLSDEGIDYEGTIDRLEDIKMKLGVSDDSKMRAQLIERFNNVTKEIADIQYKVQQDPVIKKKTRAFQANLRQAMHEIHPESLKLEKELDQYAEKQYGITLNN